MDKGFYGFPKNRTYQGSAPTASAETTDGYKIYRALLTQTGAGNPTASIILNTLRFEPTWERVTAGSYISFNDDFRYDKTWYSMATIASSAMNSNSYTMSIELNGGDGLLNKTPIEIRIYD